MSLFRKAFYLGLGAISLTREKAEKTINEMTEKGEMSREEARKFVDEMIIKGEEQKNEVRRIINDEIDKWRKEFGVVRRSEYEALEARVKQLEDKMV
ncbi:MAG: phasin family protein [Syntrophomonadaceae bacterium]|jgi:polyhydroxyalkanoate synthesis regulator phasin